MKVLLDTCTFIWMCAEPDRLSDEVRRLLDEEQTEILFSDVSALEITLKWTAGKLKLPDPPRRWIEDQLRIWFPLQTPLDRQKMYRASELPLHHADPFDRLLIATALNHDATILTPDTVIHRYPVACAW